MYFDKMGKILPNTGALSAYWRTKENYYAGAMPPTLINLFGQHDSIKQGEWNERETFEYRFAANTEENLFGCIARCRVGLFFIGMAVGDRELIVNMDPDNWLAPKNVLGILADPRFEKRHQ